MYLKSFVGLEATAWTAYTARLVALYKDIQQLQLYKT